MPLSQQWADEAVAMYTRAITGPLANNLLINFAYADFEESLQHYDKAEAVYNQLLTNKETDHTLVRTHHLLIY